MGIAIILGLAIRGVPPFKFTYQTAIKTQILKNAMKDNTVNKNKNKWKKENWVIEQMLSNHKKQRNDEKQPSNKNIYKWTLVSWSFYINTYLWEECAVHRQNIKTDISHYRIISLLRNLKKDKSFYFY